MERTKKFIEIYDKYFARSATDYAAFATILSEIAGRERPWQKTFIYNILSERDGFSVSDQMWEALMAFDREKRTALRRYAVLSVYSLEGTPVVRSGRGAACKFCGYPFVKCNPAQKYCTERCTMDAKNKRRRDRRNSV